MARTGRPRIANPRQEHPLYRVWQGMHARCRTRPAYRDRGITVCERWSGHAGFWHFVEDMGPRPAGHTLDRVDNGGNYEPSNCRWATVSEQNANRRPYANPVAVDARRRERINIKQRLNRIEVTQKETADMPTLDWPLRHFNTRDPVQIIPFLLGLGYGEERVLNTLVNRCSIDRSTARAMLAEHKPQEG